MDYYDQRQYPSAPYTRGEATVEAVRLLAEGNDIPATSYHAMVAESYGHKHFFIGKIK